MSLACTHHSTKVTARRLKNSTRTTSGVSGPVVFVSANSSSNLFPETPPELWVTERAENLIGKLPPAWWVTRPMQNRCSIRFNTVLKVETLVTVLGY